MSKFHITEDGPKPCKASVRDCKYDSDGSKHYDNINEAIKAFEAQNQESLFDTIRRDSEMHKITTRYSEPDEDCNVSLIHSPESAIQELENLGSLTKLIGGKSPENTSPYTVMARKISEIQNKDTSWKEKEIELKEFLLKASVSVNGSTPETIAKKNAIKLASHIDFKPPLFKTLPMSLYSDGRFLERDKMLYKKLNEDQAEMESFKSEVNSITIKPIPENKELSTAKYQHLWSKVMQKKTADSGEKKEYKDLLSRASREHKSELDKQSQSIKNQVEKLSPEAKQYITTHVDKFKNTDSLDLDLSKVIKDLQRVTERAYRLQKKELEKKD